MGLLEAAAALDRKKRLVWEKGRVIPDFDAAIWRWDDYGSVMKFADYGNRNSEHGWEIDHIVASALGGGDGIVNLRPLNWRNNAALGGHLSDFLGEQG